jgi:glutamate formiminotransferase/formiminotetrahydrofolate cyclodeaminase
MIMAADYYIEKEHLFIYEESQKIKLVIDRLGLSSVSQFVPEEKIIEYLISESNDGPLISMSTKDFVSEVASRTSAPGGGSVAALIASLGAGLGSMTSWLTFGIRKFEEHDKTLRNIIPDIADSVKKLIPLIDEDTNAFEDYVEAMRLPKDTEAEKIIRFESMQKGLKKAIDTPLKVMEISDSIWDNMIEAAKVINIASKSDMEIGARALELGIWGAYKNVLINMKDIEDQKYKSETLDHAGHLKDRALKKSNEILEILDQRDK